MTKKQIGRAAFFLDVYHDAHALAEEIDPTRSRATETIRDLDAIMTRARSAFVRLTGRTPNRVDAVDFNTEHPADWVRARRVED